MIVRGAVTMADDGNDLDKAEFFTCNRWVSVQTWEWCLAVVIHTAPLGITCTDNNCDAYGPVHLKANAPRLGVIPLYGLVLDLALKGNLWSSQYKIQCVLLQDRKYGEEDKE